MGLAAEPSKAVEATPSTLVAAEIVAVTPASVPVQVPEPAPAPAPAPASTPVLSPAPLTDEKVSAPVSNETGAKSKPKLIIGSVLLVALLAGGAYWFATKDKTSESAYAVTTPAAAPVVEIAPAPQAAASEVPQEEPAPVPVAAPVTPPAAQAKEETPPEKAAVVKKKLTEKKVPESFPVTPVQHVPEAPPVKVDPPPPPKPVARTIDEVLNARVAAECEKGFSGLFCREKIRFSVCDGKWSESPPPGQTACRGTGTK